MLVTGFLLVETDSKLPILARNGTNWTKLIHTRSKNLCFTLMEVAADYSNQKDNLKKNKIGCVKDKIRYIVSEYHSLVCTGQNEILYCP